MTFSRINRFSYGEVVSLKTNSSTLSSSFISRFIKVCLTKKHLRNRTIIQVWWDECFIYHNTIILIQVFTGSFQCIALPRCFCGHFWNMLIIFLSNRNTLMDVLDLCWGWGGWGGYFIGEMTSLLIEVVTQPAFGDHLVLMCVYCE